MSATLSYPRDKLRVLLFEGIHESAVELLAEGGYTNVTRLDRALPRHDLHEALANAHIVGIRSRTQLDEDALRAATKLFAIGCFCIGTNQVDLGEAARRGVPVFNAPHSNTRSVAELVVGLAVMLERDVFRKSALVHGGAWPKTARGAREVRGKTIGIIGYGHIGSQVSVLAEGLGMRVRYFDIRPRLPLGNAEAVDTMSELLRTSDIVTLHVPQTPETIDLIGEPELRTMRPGSFLINTSRGVVVEMGPLARALREGHLAGAAIDVFPTEPRSTDAPLDSPLRGMPNVILTPHVAGSTLEAQEKIGREVAAKLIGYSDSGSTVAAVNFPELNLSPHRKAHRILHIHRNVPGVMRAINQLIADENINVLAQHLETRREIGYVVLDIEEQASSRLFSQLRAVEGTVRARILY